MGNDERAILYGMTLTVADTLCGENREQAIAFQHHKGKRTFAAEALPDGDLTAIGVP